LIENHASQHAQTGAKFVPRGDAMNEITFLVNEAPEGGYTARAVGQSIFTEADDLDSLEENIRDAVHCHFDAQDVPRVVWIEF
jgi:hypothetical protein